MTHPAPTGRADARRNRVRVLRAAEQLFAEHGIAVPLGDIAQHAGVGAGTVYRHFPTKEALYSAVMRERIEQLAIEAQNCLHRTDPTAAFYGFLAQAMDKALLNTVLCQALSSNNDWQEGAMEPLRCDFKEHFGTLLWAAQREGSVRSDIGVDDVAALIPGYVAMVSHRGADEATNVINMLWDGLAPCPPNPICTRPRAGMSRDSAAECHATRKPVTKSITAEEPRCPICGAALPASATGRPAVYCGAACRQRARRRRGSTER